MLFIMYKNMKNNLSFLIGAMVILIVNACNHPSPVPSAEYMILDSVEYIEEFPQTMLLQNKTAPDIDVIGIKDFIISDSLLIFSTGMPEGLWTFLSLPDYTHYGSFLKKGQGPFEFTQLPWVSQQAISNDHGHFVFIYDFQQGKLLKMDLSETLASGQLRISLANDSLPRFLSACVVIDTATLLCKAGDNRRYLLRNEKGTVPPVMELLNQASIRPGGDHNILSTLTQYSKIHDRVVEMPIGLNYINLYAPDGSFAKTIAIGKKLYNISEIQDTKEEDRIYTFANIRVFDDFFGVIQIDEQQGVYFEKRKKLPAILLFDWNGNPLAELKPDHHVTSFDIDFNNQHLYTFDLHSDEFYKYEIKDILDKL